MNATSDSSSNRAGSRRRGMVAFLIWHQEGVVSRVRTGLLRPRPFQLNHCRSAILPHVRDAINPAAGRRADFRSRQSGDGAVKNWV